MGAVCYANSSQIPDVTSSGCLVRSVQRVANLGERLFAASCMWAEAGIEQRPWPKSADQGDESVTRFTSSRGLQCCSTGMARVTVLQCL